MSWFGKKVEPVFTEEFQIIKGRPEQINDGGITIIINESRKNDINNQFNEKVLPKIEKYVEKQKIDKQSLNPQTAISRTIISITYPDPTNEYEPVTLLDFSTKYPTWTKFLDAIEHLTVCTKPGTMTISFDLSKLKPATGGGNRRRKSRKQYRQRCAMRRVKNKTMRSRKRKVAIRSVHH